MGRIFITFLLLLCYFVTPASAASKSHQITVTATVTPSPEWISLLQTHSTIDLIDLTFFNYHLFNLHLTDGNILIINQPVTVIMTGFPTQTVLTDHSGNVSFLLPPGQPQFFYSVTGSLIHLQINPS